METNRKQVITPIKNGYIISKKPIDLKQFEQKRENYKSRQFAERVALSGE